MKINFGDNAIALLNEQQVTTANHHKPLSQNNMTLDNRFLVSRTTNKREENVASGSAGQ